MNRLRRILAIALCVVLCVIDVVLAAWLLRDAWLTPIVRRELEVVLGDALSAEVRIGPIRGSLLRDVTVEGIDVRSADATGPVEAIEGARVTATIEPFALAAGDLSGLRSVRVDARRIAIRIPPGGEPGPTDAAVDPWPETAAIRDWLDMLPDGATLRADELLLREPSGETLVAGPFRATVSPRPRRRISIQAGDVELEVIATTDGLFHVDVALEDLPRRLRALGTDLPLDGGRADVEIEGSLDDRDLRGRVSWTGGVLRDRGPAALRGTLHLRHESLQAELDVDGPGGRVEMRDLAIPLADVEDILRTARGSIALDVADLEPWRSLLPDLVAERLPIRGRLRASLDGRGLAVGRGDLRGRGFTLTIESGRLPLGGPGPEARRGRVAAELTLDETLTIPVEDEEVAVIGTARGVVEGSLEDPEFSAAVSLGEGHAFGQAWSGLRADAALQRDVITIASLDVTGARPAVADATDGARLLGTATVRLPSSESAGVTLDVDVGLEGPSRAWLAAYAPELDPERRIGAARLAVTGAATIADAPLPTGDVRVRIESLAFTDAFAPTTGTITARVDAAADGVQTFDVALDGSLDPSLLALAGIDVEPWTVRELAPTRVGLTGSFGADGPVAVAAALQIDAFPLLGSPPARIGVNASRAADGSLTVETLSVRGPLALDARGSLPAPGSDGPLDLDVTLEIAETANLAAFVPEIPPGGRATIVAKIGGTWSTAEGDLRLGARFEAPPAVLVAGWPAELGPFPDGPVGLDATVGIRSGSVVVDELSLLAGDGGTHAGLAVRAQGNAPVRIGQDGLTAGDGELAGSLELALDVPELGPARVTTPFSWRPSAFSLDEIVVVTTIAGATGRLALLEPRRALAGEPLTSLVIDGAVAVRVDDATRLPPEWLPSRVLSGALEAVLELGGTLETPAPSGRATIRDARMKLAADVPIIDRIDADIRFDPTRVELTELRARAGVGSIQAHGTLAAATDTTLLSDPEHARLDLTFTAEDALLIRATGKKLRANARIVAQGDLDRIDVTGEVDILSGRFIRRISLVPDVGTRGGLSTGAGLELFEIAPPLGDAIHFDVAVRTVDPVDIVTYVFNTGATASFRLRGTGATPYLDGAVSTASGSLRLPALTLGVSQGLMTFSADEPKDPRILLRASTRRLGIDVSMTATGRLSDPEILLSSLPPLTQQELFVLVSTGVLPETLQEQGFAGRATLVGGYLAQEIFDFYFGSDSTEQGESIVDRFHFYSGREISRNGVESLVIDFDITDSIALEGERDVYEDYNMGILYRIRF